MCEIESGGVQRQQVSAFVLEAIDWAQVGLAVNARGADHNRSGAYEADLSGDLDRTDGGAAAARSAFDCIFAESEQHHRLVASGA